LFRNAQKQDTALSVRKHADVQEELTPPPVVIVVEFAFVFQIEVLGQSGLDNLP